VSYKNCLRARIVAPQSIPATKIGESRSVYVLLPLANFKKVGAHFQ
jgi:hypothetical protein